LNGLSANQGTRLGRQELDAEILEDLEGALWRRSVIDEYRVKLSDTPEFRRIVVAIDPATSSEDESNETGIILAGLDEDGDGYVLDDAAGIHAPLEWAREAISLYRARQADRVVAEVNNGGDMIENTLRMVDRNELRSRLGV
jgi:phage terminase large subunit-like protein